MQSKDSFAWKAFGIEYVGWCPTKDPWWRVGITPISRDKKDWCSVKKFKEIRAYNLRLY